MVELRCLFVERKNPLMYAPTLTHSSALGKELATDLEARGAGGLLKIPALYAHFSLEKEAQRVC